VTGVSPRDRAKSIGLGALAGILAGVPAAVAGAWAFATFAAEKVIEPHLVESEIRVEMMCAWARSSDDRDRVRAANDARVCIAVGAKCEAVPPIPANPLLDKCGKR
jgi:hypothetical protein